MCIAGAVSDAIARVGGNIVQELMDGCGGVFGGFGLLSTDGTEGGQELVIDGLCIVEKQADDGLDPFHILGVQGGLMSGSGTNCCVAP